MRKFIQAGLVLALGLGALAPPASASPVTIDPPPGRTFAAALAAPTAPTSTDAAFMWIGSAAPSPLWSGQKCYIFHAGGFKSVNWLTGVRHYTVGADISWCAKNGLVLGGMSIQPWANNGTYTEWDPPAEFTVTPWNRTKRTTRIDWDFIFLGLNLWNNSLWKDSDLRIDVHSSGAIWVDPRSV